MLQLKDWNDLRYCVALARSGTMSAAAESLGTNPATVSRRISGITEQIGRPLFHKFGTGWRPTPLCEELISVAVQTAHLLQTIDIEEENSSDQKPIVRIGSTSGLMQTVLSRLLANNLSMLEDFEVTLLPNSGSLAMGEAEMILSFARPESGNLIAHQMAEMSFVVVGCADAEEAPSGWVEITDFRGRTKEMQVSLSEYFQKPAIVRTWSLTFARELCKSTNSACVYPKALAVTDPKLQILDGWEETKMGIWCIYHATRKLDKDLRDFTKFLKQNLIELEKEAKL